MNIKEYVDNLCIRAKNAAKQISCIDENTKNLILKAIIDELDNNREKIISANNNDVEEFKLSKNFARSFLDRLLINNERIDAIIESIKEIILFKDPVGEIKDIKTMPSGIKVGKMAMPLGVIAMIYESRPNVTIDASALSIKCLGLFMDSPVMAYGKYSKNINVIVPEGETEETTTHDTLGKNKISFEEVLTKSVELLN